MEFKGIKKLHSGKFITRYDIAYETVDHKEKIYEMISRNPDLKTQEELADHPADSVVIIMHDKSGEKILLNREFRMACGDFVINFPAFIFLKSMLSRSNKSISFSSSGESTFTSS